MLKKLITTLVIIFLYQTANAKNNEIEILHPWVREAPPGISIMAAYLTIENKSKLEQILTRITSPQFGSVEIHKSEMIKGMMHMTHVKKQSINPGSKLLFQPGGLHLMLIKPTKSFKQGDSITLVLHFKSGSPTEIKAPVLKKSPIPINHSGKHIKKDK